MKFSMKGFWHWWNHVCWFTLGSWFVIDIVLDQRPGSAVYIKGGLALVVVNVLCLVLGYHMLQRHEV